MKKFFIIFGFLLFFVSSIYSQVKVESGRVTINSNSASAEGNFVVVGSLVNYVYQDNNYNYYMRMQVGTTNP